MIKEDWRMAGTMLCLLGTVLREGHEFRYDADRGALLEAMARVSEILGDAREEVRQEGWRELLEALGEVNDQELAALLHIVVLPNSHLCPNGLVGALGEVMADFCIKDYHWALWTQRSVLAKCQDTLGMGRTQRILHRWASNGDALRQQAAGEMLGQL
jgi:hypothetical protein